jgi:hypothetical protein
MKDFAGAARPDEQEAYERGTDTGVDGDTRNAAWFRFDTLYDRNNQRMNDLAGEAQRVRDDLLRRCFGADAGTAEAWADTFGSSDRRRFATLAAMAEALDAPAAASARHDASPPPLPPAGSIR